MTTDNFTASGFGEFLPTTVETSSQSTRYSFTTGLLDADDMDNTILLFVVIAICTITLLLMLVCVTFFCCKEKIFFRNSGHNSTVHRVLLSKSTSVTGLNGSQSNIHTQEKPTITVVEVLKQGVKFKKSSPTDDQAQCVPGLANLKQCKNYLITSTPTLKKETSKSSFSSPQLTIVKECQHCHISNSSLHLNYATADGANAALECDECKQSFVKQNDEKSHEGLTSPTSLNPVSSINWATTRMFQSANSDMSSRQIYATADSHVLDSDNTTGMLSNLDDVMNEEKHLLSSDNGEPSSPSHVSNGSNLNASLPLPLNVLEQPKAWFVPLNETHREPLRHSVIDVSNQHQSSTLKSKEHDGSTKKEKKLNCPAAVNQDCNPGDPNSKKPSLWEKLEGRPVVFLEKNEVVSSPSPTSMEQEE